jgi:diguanylate cyclase (GGDEF)-like protein/PAS domain S-box-containing protein
MTASLPAPFFDSVLGTAREDRRLPRRLSWLLSLLVTAISLALGTQPDVELVLLWGWALSMCAIGALGGAALLAGLTVSGLGHVALSLLHNPREPVAEMLVLHLLVGAFGVAILRGRRLAARLHEAKGQVERLHQLSRLWDQVEDCCVLEIDPQGNVRGGNAGARKLLAQAPLLRHHWDGLWSGDSARVAREALDKACTGSSERFAGWSVPVGGVSRWLEVTLLPVLDGQQLEKVLCLARDLTALHEAEARARAGQDEVRLLLESIGQGFYQADTGWRIVKANAVALQVLGRRGLQVGSSLLEHYAASGDDNGLVDALRDVMELRFPRHFQWCSPWDEHWYRIDAYPYDGGMYVLFEDVSADVDRLRQTQAAQARLRLTQQVGRFADWSLDLASRELQLSEQAGQLLGLPLNGPAHQELLIECLSGDDRLRFVAALLDVLDGATGLDIRISLGDPSRHFHFMGSVIHPQGCPKGLLVGSVHDITEQEYRERELYDAQAFNRSIIDALPQQVAVLDERGQVIACNQAWQAGAQGAGVVPPRGQNYLTFCKEQVIEGCDAMQAPLEGVEALIEGIGEPFQLYYSREGRHYQLSARLMGTEGLQVLVLNEDITDDVQLRDRLSRSETRLRDMVQHLPQVFWVYEVASNAITYASPAFERWWGIPCERLYEDPLIWLSRVHPEDRATALSFHKASRASARPTEIEYRLDGPDGQLLWIRTRVFPCQGEDGRVERVIGIVENVTEARLAQQRLFSAINFDAVTGLPNQSLLLARLQQACRQATEQEQPFSLLVISLSRFTRVSQLLGPLAADQLLRQFGEHLVALCGEDGYLARIDTDSFALLLELPVPDALVTRLLEVTRQPLRVSGETVRLGPCIGIADFARHGGTAEALLRHARAAAYHLSKVRRSGVQRYDPVMHRENLNTLKLEEDIERAVRERQFTLHYQPKLGLADGRLQGVEALLRWEHPEYGLVPPLRFMPLLEDAGHLQAVGQWSLDQALAQLAAWQQGAAQPTSIAVNLSSRQLEPGLVEFIRAALARHGLAADQLELELAEPVAGQGDAAGEVIAQLKALGVRIAVDGFGTGSATLGSLRAFAPHIVKIDRSFLLALEEQEADRTIVRSVIDMSHALGMTVVAEGVEREGQAHVLRELGCDQVQGFWISPPLPAQTFAARYLDA